MGRFFCNGSALVSRQALGSGQATLSAAELSKCNGRFVLWGFS
jgi:hypothetical protein